MHSLWVHAKNTQSNQIMEKHQTQTEEYSTKQLTGSLQKFSSHERLGKTQNSLEETN